MAEDATSRTGTATAPLGDLAAVLSNITGSGGTFPVVEVFTGATVVDVPVAAQRARDAQRDWASWPVERRMAVFGRFHELVLQHQPRIGDQGLLKFTDATTIATLERPLPTPTTRDEDENAVKRTIPALRLMRKLRIR
ncbi:hypothetical protein [Nocardioides dongkuii]|uniref:hypothetical protein n=1 Tax=Nocardioides dongkuii TaxID=2760089 RepID=UPI001877DCC2|nr:hypothetical protein [Nocardioides dongkuii]